MSETQNIPCGGCGRFKPGTPYTLDQCRLCWLFHHNEDYTRLWGGGAKVKAKVPCRHLGAETGVRTICSSCAGKVQLKLFACSVFGACTVSKPVEGHGCCQGCQEYQPLPS